MATAKKCVDASKELELLNFKALLLENPELYAGNKEQNEESYVTNWYPNNKISPGSKKPTNKDKNQFTAFQEAMKLLLIYGRCLALIPVGGLLHTEVSKIRYSWLSWNVFYTITVGVSQATATALSIFKLIGAQIFIRSLAYCSFYMCTCCTTFMFLRVASKWPSLMRELHNSGLSAYVDPRLKFKCYLAFFVFTFVALFEHIFSQLSKFTETIDCTKSKGFGIFENFTRTSFPWAFSFGEEYNVASGIALHVLNIISTFNWSYPDLFIICVSIYLTSILITINKKIEWAYKNNYLPPSFWRCLREDYNRATLLVRSFDNRISGIVFISFANNLFFICLQFYYSLASGLKSRQRYFQNSCPNYPSGPFGGYESSVYLIISLSFLCGKFLAVSLIASDVNTASIQSAPALYNIASSMYCAEIQRFLDQVHGDTVALSGFRFFLVTREIILSVAGTIVTYELVMLQFTTD